MERCDAVQCRAVQGRGLGSERGEGQEQQGERRASVYRAEADYEVDIQEVPVTGIQTSFPLQPQRASLASSKAWPPV